MGFVKWLIWFGLISTSAAIIAGYFGALHPLGDSLAVFRRELSVLLLVLSVIGMAFHFGRLAQVGLALALSATLPIVWGMRDQPAVGDYAHYQKNLLWNNNRLDDAIADIAASDAQVVTLQELSAANMRALDALSQAYPSQNVCASSAAGRVAVLSVWPKTDVEGVCGTGIAAMQVIGPDGPLWLVSLHLKWPWPFDQAAQLPGILALIETLDGPIIVAGDFNMVPWGNSVRQIAQASNTRRTGQIRQTLRLGRYNVPRLPIDHVLLPQGWTGGQERRGTFGADHYGLLTRWTVAGG